MSTFLKSANLSRIHTYIYGEYIRYLNSVNEERLKQKQIAVSNLLTNPDFIERHKPFLEWVDKHPKLKVYVDGYHSMSNIEKIATYEVAHLYNLTVKPDRAENDAVISYLHFKMPEDRTTAIKLILEKYYNDKDFIAQFEYV
jgi:hypothetical protein